MQTPDPSADSSLSPQPISYRGQNGEVGMLMDRLIELRGGSPHADLVRDILVTALKLIDDNASRYDLKVINSALKEMRYTAKVFSPYRRTRKVTIFGSARVAPGSPIYRQAEEFARKLAERGFMSITGAGGGVMEAGHVGARPENSFGVNIRLPFEQDANPVIAEDPKLISYKYFFTRKLAFIKETDAVACFPGGFGTHDEGNEALTLVQTGKRETIPILMVDAPGGGYWRSWRRFVEETLLGNGMISEQDLHLFLVTDDVDQAVEEIARFYRRYHSQRFIRDEHMVRVTGEVSDAELAELSQAFADMLVGDRTIRRVPPYPEEELAEDDGLTRLAMPFNRASYGRLRQLIDRLNEL
jgi:uncharacterized protein (TIGR00730 family)